VLVERGTNFRDVAFCQLGGVTMFDKIRRNLTRIGELTTQPAAFAVVALYAIAWSVFLPSTFGWSAIATLATWMMTLFINRTGHRDPQAIHAKIGELLRVDSG
jgi:low affinity Fe/Cu permease